MLPFNIIAAVDSKMGIGKNNTIPWRLPNEMKYFQDVTTANENNVVIMGRNTWESIPANRRPLKNRINIVLSRNENYQVPDGVLVFKSLDEVLSDLNLLDVFIIGGAQIYNEAISHPLCKKIYLTQIEQDFRCDTFFPLIPNYFKEISRSTKITEKGIDYRYLIYERP